MTTDRPTLPTALTAWDTTYAPDTLLRSVLNVMAAGELVTETCERSTYNGGCNCGGCIDPTDRSHS